MFDQESVFTPTQKRFLKLLRDGKPHTSEEFCELLGDEQSGKHQVHVQFSVMRRILRPRGEDIICQMVGKKAYFRLIRFESSLEEEPVKNKKK